MSNVITAYFKGRVGVAESLYQNDYGIVMNFDSIVLPAHFDCYFSVPGSDTAIPGVGADNRVVIPNAVLANSGNVAIHIPLHTGDSDSEVEYIVYFKVIGRARPEDDGTPVQMTAIEQALALLQNPIGNIEQIVNEALSFTGDTFAEMEQELQDDFDNYTETLEGDLATWKGGVESDFDVLQGQFDTAVAAVTTDTEVTDIRVGADGITDTTAGASVRRQFTELKSEINEFLQKYKGAIPISYTINSNRVSIASAFYTVTNNIVHRVILLRITTSSITSANTWTLGHISAPIAGLQAVASDITYNAVSLSGGSLSGMTFKQTTGGSGNFQLVTTGAVSYGQGGLIMLTYDQAITSTTITPFADTEYPQNLLNKTILSEDLFDASLTYSGKGWHIGDSQLKTLSGYSFIQCRVQGGSSIKVSGMSESMSSYGYAIRNSSGTVIASGGESDGMVIDIPDNGYLLIFTYKNSDTIKLIPYMKKMVVVLGDSWSDNDPEHTTYTKWTTLLERDGRYKVKVYAQNGSSISGDTPNYGLNGNVAGQMQQLKSDGIKNVDYVIIFGGINDFRGTVSNPYVYNKVAEFYNTLNAMYPDARIIYIANNQIFITQQQLNYFHEIVDYLRTNIGMEAFTTFGWVHPSHYLTDYVHVDDNGYKDLYANILSILNGGDIDTVKVSSQFTDGNTTLNLYEEWVNGLPKYSAKTIVSSSALGSTFTATTIATDGKLLASVPFAKILNKAYPTSADMPKGMVKCDIAETFTTTSRLNTTNEFTVYNASANAGTYFTDNYN